MSAVEYRFSTLLTPSEDETGGLCDGIPVRKHIDSDLEEIGTFKAQQDWTKYVQQIQNYKGGLGPTHSFMAVSLPECLPDRFEIVSYANEFAFLHDDVTDILDQENADIKNDEVLEAFLEGARNGRIDALKCGKRRMQAKILNTMIAIDRPRAMVAVRAWASFMEQGAGRQHHRRFCGLDEYLPYRCEDVGHMFWYALVTFGCAITIPENEISLCADLVVPALIAASLTNDLFSYEKEHEAAQLAGLPDVVNALWVIMHEHNISLEEAKLRCRSRIKKEVMEYSRIVKETSVRNDLSKESKKYIELMQYSVSGNVIWSHQCPRYHKTAQYNERQILRARQGIAEDHTLETSQNGYSTAQLLDEKKGVRPVTACAAMELKTRKSINLTDENLNNMADHVDDEWDVLRLVRSADLPDLKEDLILEPFHYISSLPSKGIRDLVIDGISVWLRSPPQSTEIIRRVIRTIHNSSLMIDDVQDRSQLRRGSPSTHIVFGEAQTINSATFQYVLAISELQRLRNPLCFDIFVNELRSLFIGQGYELHWTNEVQCPTVAEYLQMLDGKTGGLFRLLGRLIAAESRYGNHAFEKIDRLCCLLGRYFQIRDDYQNLASEEYAAKKGFCEDLDEGKFSLPLIHAMKHTNKVMQLRGLLHQRQSRGGCSLEQKRLILKCITEAGSLTYTRRVLHALHKELEREVKEIENFFGQENHEIRLLLSLLEV